MTLEEALAEIEKLKGEAAKVGERLANAEALIGRQGTELGDLRKHKTESESTITTLKSEKAALEQKISGGARPAGGQQNGDEDPDKLEASLTESQARVLDEAWAKAPRETRERIVSDPKVRLAFIKEAMQIAPTAPDTWRKTTPKAEQVLRVEDEIKNLFGKHRQNRSTPLPGRAGSVREAGGREGESGAKVELNPSDVSGSLRRMREQRTQSKE